MPLGKHYGSFAKGFMDSLLAAYKLSMTKELYDARINYFNARAKAYGTAKGTGVNNPELQNVIGGARADPTYGGSGAAPSGDDFNRIKTALTGTESGGSYDAINSRTGATGRYQVMPQNIGPWTQKYLGSPMTQQEFRNNPEAQDKVFEGEMNAQYQKYGNWRDAVSVWHSGVPYAQAVAEHRNDGNMSTENYTNGILSRANVGAGDTSTVASTGSKQPNTGAPAAAPLDDPKLAEQKPEAVAAVSKALDSAKTMLGKNEVPDRQAIMDYLHNGGQDLDPHQSAWCASFVSASLQKAGLPIPTTVIPGSDFGPGAYAGNYRTWGTAVRPNNIQSGDVLVSNDGSHVGFAEGPVRQGKNGPEVQLIAGNEKDTSGKYQPGSYTSKAGNTAQRAQVGQVGERWVPLSQYSARRAVPGDATSNATAVKDGKPGQTAQANTPYKVAGDAGAVTEAGAERAKADLEAHRATPDQPSGRTGPAEVNVPLGGGVYDPRTIDPTHTSYTPDAAGNLAPPAAAAPYRPEDSPSAGPVANEPSIAARGAATAPGGPWKPDNEADKPAPDTTPVSGTGGPRAIPSAPTQDPRFVQVDAPNQNPNARGQPRQTTAIDLSHLWGPNPPVADRAPAPPGSPPPPPPVAAQPPNDWQSAVGTPDMTDVSFSAKGGPITRRVSLAKGGALPSRPTMNLAAGGASSAYPSYTPAAPVAPKYGLSGNTLAADQYMTGLPGMGAVDLTQNVPGYYTSYGPGQGGAGGQALTSDWSKMTPDQLSQYNAMVAGTWQPPAATPAAAPAAAVPAPAPVLTPPSVQNITTYQGTPTDPSGVNTIDPTSTTTTGTPGVPTTGLQAATYDPNKIATTGTGSATDSTGGTDYTTDPNDNTKQILSAKGGAIPPLPTTRFAGAGAVSPNPVIAAMYAGTYNGPSSGGNWVGSTPYSALAPNQQAWADQQKGVWGQINAGGAQDAAYWGGGGQGSTGPVDTSQYLSQLSMMPTAIWPTAAPAAPTPIAQPAPTVDTIQNTQTGTPADQSQAAIAAIDPTSTTTTGTPGVPTTGLLAKTYDPNNIATTGTGSATDNTGSTNYSTDPKDNTTQILSRKGGPITRRVTRRYDDGGGVSPSAMGMPPGMGGASGAIPPIYYNPATYAGAGAPVGKGVTAASAPTFGAGAIPSLPMARGGSVGYADGGDVGDDDPMGQQMDFEAMQDDGAASAAPPTPRSDADAGWYINPNDIGGAAATPAAPVDHNAPPADPTAAQISDGQGNPSRGLIGAISDGLHWLGDHLGLVGSANAHPAIAGDPQTQDNRQKYITNHPDGMTYITHQNVEELNDLADPNHQLQGAYRNIAGLEAGYKWAMAKGDSDTAGRLSASLLHYSVLTSQNLSAQAQKSLYEGNLPDAVEKTNQALDAVPDGRNIHVTLNPDGKTVTVTGSDLNGQQLWQKYGAAGTVLEHATALGKTGKLQWDSLEDQASKYDHTYRDMATNRTKNQIARGKENQDKAAQTSADEAIGKLGPQFEEPSDASPVTPRVTPAIAPAPDGGATTASTPTAPASGGTAAATPPASADENQGQGPTVANAQKGAGLPSTPTQGDLPSPDAQDTDLMHNAAYQNIVAQTAPKYFTADGRPLVGGRAMVRPPTIDQVTLKTYAPQVKAAYDERWTQYRQAVQENQAAMRQDIDGQRRDIGADIISRRQADVTAHSDAAAAQRAADADRRQTEREQSSQTFNEQAPLTPQQRQEIYKGSSPMEVTASLPRYAVPDGKGGIDANKSAQALGQAYDLPPPGGGAATGGLARATTVANVSEDAASYNTHMGVNAVHDLVDGLARGVYTIDGRPTPVTRHGEQLDQFTVHQQPGDPGVTLFLPKQSGYNIVRIRNEFENAKPKPPATATPTSAIPKSPMAPFQPQPFTAIPAVKGALDWVGSHSVHPTQMTPEQQRQYYGIGQ
jgi:hypothetical protein